VCCDATVCSATSKGVGMPIRATCSVSSPQPHVALWVNGTDYPYEELVDDHASVGSMSRVTKKSVRQCARRCDHHSGVAQASPLFSDNAPREVHLWQ
jgi:hypothetical protein